MGKGMNRLRKVQAERKEPKVLTGDEVHELGEYGNHPKSSGTGHGVRATGHGARGTGDGVRDTGHGSEPPSFLSTSGPIWTKADGTRMYKKKVSFPLDLYERIEAEAKAAGVTISQFITVAVEERLNKS